MLHYLPNLQATPSNSSLLDPFALLNQYMLEHPPASLLYPNSLIKYSDLKYYLHKGNSPIFISSLDFSSELYSYIKLSKNLHIFPSQAFPNNSPLQNSYTPHIHTLPGVFPISVNGTIIHTIAHKYISKS